MSRNIHKTDVITLEGFQAILEPSKFGYSLAAVVGDDVINTLQTERDEVLKWAESKLKNPRHRFMQDLLLNLVFIRNLISSEMELPMVVLSSWLVYRWLQ